MRDCQPELRDIFDVLIRKPGGRVGRLQQHLDEAVVCSSATFPPKVAASITWGPQQNRLNAPGLSVAADVKVPERIAAQTPEAICTSKFFACRKKS